jgi:hypothetical protein
MKFGIADDSVTASLMGTYDSGSAKLHEVYTRVQPTQYGGYALIATQDLSAGIP